MTKILPPIIAKESASSIKLFDDATFNKSYGRVLFPIVKMTREEEFLQNKELLQKLEYTDDLEFIKKELNAHIYEIYIGHPLLEYLRIPKLDFWHHRAIARNVNIDEEIFDKILNVSTLHEIEENKNLTQERRDKVELFKLKQQEDYLRRCAEEIKNK